jgi:glutamyl-tRNA reductase
MKFEDNKNIGNFWLIGVNYKKTDASIRGQFAVNPDQYDMLLSLAPQQGINEFFILSTCNRTEIYGFADSAAQLADFLCSVTVGGIDTFSRIAYYKNETEAIEHLFHVAAGLDSQILGDYEILGQIKNAVKQAKSKGFIGAFMERLINCVLQASKAVKTNTVLSGGTISTSFAAIQYIKKYFCCPAAHTSEMYASPSHKDTGAHQKKIVLLGTGKIGRITCKNLVDYIGTHNITLINRTEETALNLAKELELRSAPIEALATELADADIILVSTAATEPIILKDHLEGKGRKLVIDMSVPCNVHIEAQQLPDVTFADIDMLSKIKDETLQQRKAEVPKAIEIINEHITEFKAWHEMRKNVPLLKEIKNKLKEIYIAPLLLANGACPEQVSLQEEKIQKVINALAIKMRNRNSTGCHYFEAINDFATR